MTLRFSHGLSFQSFYGYLDQNQYVDTGSTQFLREDGLIRARAGHVATNAWFSWDGKASNTLWVNFRPIENEVSGDSGTPQYKLAWSSKFYDVTVAGDRTSLESLWVAAFADKDTCLGQSLGGTYGPPVGRYLYMRARLDRSGADNPSLMAGGGWLEFEPPLPTPDSVAVVLNGDSPFIQVRALRRQPKYVTFDIINGLGGFIDLTGVRVQLFMRNSNGDAVGLPRAVNVVNALAGSADIQFSAVDMDLPTGTYVVEVIAWKQPNFVRREFSLVVEESAVPAGWDPTVVAAEYAVPYDAP